MKNFEIIENPRKMYKKMLKDMEKAEASIFLEIYIYSNDKIGRLFRKVLEKKEKQGVRLTNSDPKVIKFMLKWFKQVWNISKDQIKLAIIINRIHKNRIKEVEEYWSKITKIPKNQFNKTILIKAKNKKHYDNFPVYFGTLTIKIKQSTNLHRQITGMIEGLRTMPM